MGEELVPVSELAVGKYSDDKAFGAISKGSEFLPRLQLFSSNNKEVKRSLIGQGRYGIVRGKENIEDLSPSVEVIVLAWRPKAMCVDGDDVTAIYNPANAEFIRIQERAENETDSGCFYGPEFLLFVPSASPPSFVTFLCGNKTMRMEAPNLKALMGKASLFKNHLIEKGKYTWHGPIFSPCSTPLVPPSIDDIREQVQKFNNPKEKEVEAAPEEAARPR